MADEQVTRVKQANDIVEVIGSRIQLKKAGRNFKGLCPFHGEKTPSFFVSAEMQMFKCFGCGVNGDVFSFVQEYEGLTFPEALESLAEKAGIQLERRQRSKGEQEQEELVRALHLGQEYYHYLLMEHKVGEVARKYLRDRGVAKQMWKDFGLGYAPDSWRAWQDYMVKKKGFKNQVLVNSGMVIRSDRGGHYDRFRGRIMFPLRDFSGKTVGFSGRLLQPNAKEAKYVNTPETSIYHKGEMLYGMSKNKRAIREKDRVVVVEGEMDVISSVQAGVKEVVAVKGSALTEQQALLIRRLTRNIVLAMDADDAGQEAMKRAIDVAEEKAMNLRVLDLSGGKDPDEIAREDGKKWRQMSKKTVSIYQFYIDWAFENFDAKTGSGQKQISKYLAPILAKIENAVERDFYVRKLSDELGVAKRVVEQEVVKAEAKVDSKEKEVDTSEKKMDRQERLERYAIGVGLQWGANLKREWVKLELEWFTEGYLRKLVEVVDEIVESKENPNLADVQASIGNESLPLLMELYGEDKELLLQTKEELRRIYDKARENLEQLYTRRRLKQLNQEMTNVEDEVKIKNLREEYRRLKSQK